MIEKKVLFPATLLIVLVPIFAYAESGMIPVDVSGTAYNIDYQVDGVKINTITADLDTVSLLLQVEVTAPGLLEITFDRAYFDSTNEGSDEPFIILADGEDISFAETGTTPETRTLKMELPTGTEEVEIIGTHLLDGTFGALAGNEETPVEPPVTPEQPPAEQPETPPPEQAPVEETPPVVEQPQVQPEQETSACGPGTILKDGACVLDERCGTGTHFENGVCVLDEQPSTSKSGLSLGGSNTSQLIVSITIGFGIAAVIMVILWSIGRAGRSKPPAASSL